MGHEFRDALPTKLVDVEEVGERDRSGNQARVAGPGSAGEPFAIDHHHQPL